MRRRWSLLGGESLDKPQAEVDGPAGMAKLAMPDTVGIDPARVVIDVLPPQDPSVVRADAGLPCRVELSKQGDLRESTERRRLNAILSLEAQ